MHQLHFNTCGCEIMGRQRNNIPNGGNAKCIVASFWIFLQEQLNPLKFNTLCTCIHILCLNFYLYVRLCIFLTILLYFVSLRVLFCNFINLSSCFIEVIATQLLLETLHLWLHILIHLPKISKKYPGTVHRPSCLQNLWKMLWTSKIKLSFAISTILCSLDGNITENIICQIISKHSHLRMGDEKYGSIRECRARKSAFLMALWLNEDGDINPENALMRPAVASHYFNHKILLDDCGPMLTFAFAVSR